jgi:hypothetical protein
MRTPELPASEDAFIDEHDAVPIVRAVLVGMRTA